MSGHCGPECGCGSEHFMGRDDFPNTFEQLFGREHGETDLASMANHLGSMPKKEREKEIAKMPEHMRRALGIKIKTVRKQSGHILSEAKLRGRDTEIEQLEEVVEAFEQEIADLDKKLETAESEKKEMINNFQEQYAEQVESFAKSRKKLKKKLATAGDELVRLQEQIEENNRVINKLGDENKFLLQKSRRMEELHATQLKTNSLIMAIDTRANKPLIVEQIVRIKKIAAENRGFLQIESLILAQVMNAGGVDKACKSRGFRPSANGLVTRRNYPKS
jgi:chromosome segregation ATPase